MKITNKQVRSYLGHDGENCVVVCKRNGQVTRYGSPNPFNRQFDWTQNIGNIENIKKQIIEEANWNK